MIVELLTIGDELLDGRRIDTNSAWLGRRFTSLGFPPRYRQSVTDRMEDIADAFRRATRRADWIVSTGGLGPTADDITFEALATALGRGLVFHPAIFEKIERRFAERGLRCPPSNRRQAHLPEGAVELANDWGTAPGCRVDLGSQRIFVFPGVPLEMENLARKFCFPEAERTLGLAGRRVEKGYKFVGLPESVVEERVETCRLGEIEGAEIRVAYTATFPQIDVTLSIVPLMDDRFPEVLRTVDDRISAAFGDHLVARDDETLESRVVSELRRLGFSLAVAESLTGGLVAAQLVGVPGCSDVFDRGLVTYSEAAKVSLARVSEETIRRHGAVSEACALEMARGVRGLSGTSIGLATTGIAGPDGGTPEKPVGLTYIAWAGPGFEEARKFQFRWDRNRNRMLAATEALRGLLRLVASPNFKREKE